MNSESGDGLVALVDFKWLMAGVGWRVDLRRLQQDGAYVDQCLQRALASGSAVLRGHGARLRRLRHTLEVPAGSPTVEPRHA